MARELYGDDKYSSNTTTTSSSSSSFRTKTQKRDDRSRHSNFLESEMRKQDMLIREQDSSLEMLSSNLTRLGDISHVVSRELDEQAILLDDLDLEVEKAEDGLTRVNLLAKDLIRKSGGPGWFCLILFLSMIALFLFFLVVYTWKEKEMTTTRIAILIRRYRNKWKKDWSQIDEQERRRSTCMCKSTKELSYGWWS